MSHSQISSLSTAILALKKPEVVGSQIWTVGVLTDLDGVMFYQKACTRAVEWAGALS